MDESTIIMTNGWWGDGDAPSEFGGVTASAPGMSRSDDTCSSQDYFRRISTMGLNGYASQMYCIVEE